MYNNDLNEENETNTNLDLDDENLDEDTYNEDDEEIEYETDEDFEEENDEDYNLIDTIDDLLKNETNDNDNEIISNNNTQEEEGNNDITNLVSNELENIETNKNILKLFKWSTTNLKNMSNYEDELQLLTNEEKITILKTTKTNIQNNRVVDNEEIKMLFDIENINIDMDAFILKMHKYYLISISLGLIQKKILLEKQAILNFNFINSELSKMKDFKKFLLDYNQKQTELQNLHDIEEYLDSIKKAIGANKK